MKKIMMGLLLGLTACIIITGCNQSKKTGGWEIDLDGKTSDIEEKALEVFNSVASDKYTLVALLGKQVVAGTNYMYLCKDDSYKVVIIYNDLEGKSTITNEKEFDFEKYTYENISNDKGVMIGGWNVDLPVKKTVLKQEVQEVFDNTTKNKEIRYYPITLLGHQTVSGTNYAILCYGYIESEYENLEIYLLTLHKGLNGKEEFISSAYVDLSEYNS